MSIPVKNEMDEMTTIYERLTDRWNLLSGIGPRQGGHGLAINLHRSTSIPAWTLPYEDVFGKLQRRVQLNWRVEQLIEETETKI